MRRNRRIRLISLFLALCTVAVFSGCMSHTELDKAAIIEAVGVDYENGQYTATVQYFNMDSEGGSTMVDNTKPNVIVVSGSGRTVSDALEDASYRSGKAFMLGITGLFVIGNEASKQDIKPLLSFATSNHQSNPKMYIAVAEGKASDIMQVRFKEGAASVNKLESLFRNADNLGLCAPLKLYEVMKKLSQPTKSLVLPLIKVNEDGGDFTEDGKNIVITGGALISDSKLTDSLSVKEVAGLQFLSDSTDTSQLTVSDNGEDVTVILYDVSTDITPRYSKGKLGFTINITADGKYVNSNLSNPAEKSGRVEKLCEKAVQERVALTVEKLLKKNGADAADLKYSITSKEYFSWLKIEENYRELLKNGSYDIKCDVTIRRFSTAHSHID